jgi:hypothetical protein
MNKIGQNVSRSFVYFGLWVRGCRREAEIQKPSKLLYMD